MWPGCRTCATSNSGTAPTADVQAFPGVRYYLARAGDMTNLVAPPYDVIPEQDLAHYRGLSPYNVVRLIRPGSDYEGAGRSFNAWLDDRILEPDPASMYVHEVTYDGGVRPHERTHLGPKADRLALTRAVRASLEPLWFLYDGGQTELPTLLEKVAARAAAVSFTGPEGTHDRLWVISDPAIHDSVHAALESLQLLIADGHHRYETALAYAEEVAGGPDDPARFTLALLTDLADPGLAVLPTHRVMKSAIAVTGGEPTGSLEETLAGLPGRVAAGTYRAGKFQVLPLEGDVAVQELHEQVIDNLLGKRSAEDQILYTRDPEQAVRWVDEGEGVLPSSSTPPTCARF